MAQPIHMKISRPLMKPIAKMTHFLTFSLGSDTYGIDILKIKEIKNFPDVVTPIAHSPAHISGITHLDDVIVPIIDLCIYYHIEKENTSNPMMILLCLENKLIGLSVNSVFDIIGLTADQIKSAPDFCTIVNNIYINGVGISNNNIILLLDVDKLLFSKDLQLMDASFNSFLTSEKVSP